MKPKFFLLALIFLSLSSCQKSGYVKMEGMVWNTVYHITYNGPESLKDSVLTVLQEVSNSLNVFNDNSLVSKLNKSDSIKADSHLLAVFESSKKINSLSHGNFDPTLSPLITAWGFGKGHQPTLDTLKIDSILQFVGLDKTFSQNGFIYKLDPRIQFNFSAIAKGYGADAIADMFKRNKVYDYMVEIGGEIALNGLSPSGDDWKIAIDAPLEENLDQSQVALIISLTDCGMATSGNYRNFRNEGGVKTAHTISPQTGRPFFSKILSATVIASSCMEADALATACMASEPAQAKKMLEEANVNALLIFADSLWMSPGFKALVISEASELGKTARN